MYLGLLLRIDVMNTVYSLNLVLVPVPIPEKSSSRLYGGKRMNLPVEVVNLKETVRVERFSAKAYCRLQFGT